MSDDEKETETKAAQSVEDEDDQDYEDETISERIMALSEIFPERLRNVVSKVGSITKTGTIATYRFSRSAMWIFTTSFLVLVLPVVFEVEMTQMEQAQIQKERQILLGPNAAYSGSPAMPAGLAPAPMAPQPR